MSLYTQFVGWATGTEDQAVQQQQLDAGKAKFVAAQANREDAANQAANDPNYVYDASSGGWYGPGGDFIPDYTPAQKAADTGYVNGVQLDNTDTAAVQGFAEGAQQGLQNVLNAPGQVVGAVGSGANTLLGGILKNIPWWVWLVGAGALFVWMGGLSLLRGKLARQ